MSATVARICRAAALAAAGWLAAVASAGELGLQWEMPPIAPFQAPAVRVPYDNALHARSPAILKLDTKLFTPQENIDFERRQVTFSRVDALGFAFWTYHYGELSDYLFGRQQFSLYRGWYDQTIERVMRSGEVQAPHTALDFSLPVQYPKWAQRVLGKEPPKLTIDGYLTLTVSYDATRQEPQGQLNSANSGFKFDQENKFTIRGSIGRVINIGISAGSDQSVDFENELKKFKIEYKDDNNELEDEVIQEVVAGYTGFEMPDQGLAGYSESHEGLFGIKVRAKLGPVMLTTIASNEQGETQKLTRSAGGGGGGQTVLTEKDFVKGKFFFLDTLYLRHYLRVAASLPDPVPPAVDKGLQLWISAVLPPGTTKDPTQTYRDANLPDGSQLTFKLIHNGLYSVDWVAGWVRLDSLAVGDNEVLAVYMRSTDAARMANKGDTTIVGRSPDQLDVMKQLAVLKNASAAPGDGTYQLAWRNVYKLPHDINPNNFELDITFHVPGQDTVKAINGLKIARIMGLLDNNDRPRVSDKFVFDDIDGYLVIPPFANALVGNQPFRNPLLGDSAQSDIYDSIWSAVTANHRDHYTISMTGSTDSRSTRIDNLGWGVMQGTERVKADGHLLVRDVDYTIDYEMGSIELISDKAKAAGRIDVEYQREALFVPDQKVFLGAHARLDLPFIGKSSYIGASVMWQDATTTEKIPRIGQEPYTRLLLDVNTSMEFEPEWMTKLVNWLPFVKTDAPSKADLKVEVAHSLMNPNTDGQAYVDDFEANKQVYPLGQSALTWHQASPPWELVEDTLLLLRHPPAWETSWFNPDDDDASYRIARDSIWVLARATKDLSSSERYEHILRLHTIPAPPGKLRPRYVSPWSGIMTSVPASFADRQEDKYLELWARDSGGGRLTVDFGVLSEDLSLDGGPPNGKENTEDTKGNNEPDARLDLGLDTLPDHDEVLRVPDTATGQWVTLDSAALADSGYPGRAKDPALDNWAKYDRDNLENRDRYTRLQGNGGVLNSEDYSQDGFVSADHERGFRAVIDFDSMHAALSRHNGDVEQLSDSEAARLFVQKGTNRNPRTGWYLFRVPIHADSTLLKTVQAARAPAPTLREIKTVRLVWSGWKEDSTLAAEKQLLLTDIQFVGNQWQEVPRRSADSTLPAKIQALSINNIDDTAYLNDVDPLVRSHALDVNWQKDSHNDWKREQALRLPFSGLLPGEDALVDRRFNYQAWDLSSYHELSLLVHSDQDQTAKGVYFVFRFGTDSATYYEYRSDLLRQGWNGPGNKLTIRLKDLADLKLAYLNAYGDTVTRINTMGGNGHYRIYSAGGKLPTFSSITWMALGVVRDSSGGTDSAQGELWVDEMKVTGVHELSGWAARASFTTKWADFMDFSMTGEYTDGDFRTMTEDLLRPGATTLRTTMDASLRLDKFLPAEWGVSIPLGAMASGTLTRPQQKPGTDIALTNSQNQSDQLGDMFADAMANMLRETPVKGVADHRTTPSEHYQAAQLTRSWYTKYEKAAKSKNLATKLLAERISLSYNYRYDFSSTARGEKPTGGDYVDSNRTETYTGTLKYDLSPRQPPAWTRWKPFDKTKSPWLPLPFKNYELTFLPSTLRFDLLDVNYTRGDVYTAKIDKLDLLRKLNVTHGFAFNWEPVRPLLGMGYSLSIVRGLDDALVGRDGNLGERWWPVISDDLFAMHRDEGWSSRGLLNGEESRTQKVSLDFKPQFFDWLTHEFHYGADYGERVVGWPSDSTRDYCNLTVGTQFGFKSAFEFVSFLQGMADRTKRFKGLSTLFSAAGKGLDKIGLRSVSFDYNARSDLLNNYVGTDYLGGSQQYMWDFLLYQIGAKGRTLGDLMSGDMNDGTAAGGMRYRAPYDVPGRYSGDQRSVSQDFALATSLRMPDPVNISIDPIKLSWDRHYMVKPDPLYYDTTVTWPKVAVGVSTPLLGKIGALKKLLESLTLNSQYSYERSVGIKGLASVSTDDSGRTIRARPTPDTTEHNAWEPLVKVDGRLKKLPISAHFEWRFSTDTRVSTSWSHTRKNSQELGIDYELQKSLKERAIKIFRWSIPIRGKFTAGVALKRSDETSYQGGGSDSSRVTNRAAMKDAQYRVKETTSYSLIPKLGYVFTDNVDAELSYEGSKDDVQPENRKIYSNVGKLIVRIKF